MTNLWGNVGVLLLTAGLTPTLAVDDDARFGWGGQLHKKCAMQIRREPQEPQR